MRNCYVLVLFILILYLNDGQSYVHEYVPRRVEPQHQHRQTSYISPVTYQAKATFNAPRHREENVVHHRIQRNNVHVRQLAPRDAVVRHHAPVTYQTYDRRALGIPETAPAVHQPVRYAESRRQFTPSRPSGVTFTRPRGQRQQVYQTVYRPPVPVDAQRFGVQQEPQQHKLSNNVIRYDYNRGGTRRDDRYVPSSAARRASSSAQHRPTFYGQPAPRRTYEYRRPSRHYDPCINMFDGQYVLNHDFKKLFPYVDNMCYFVKCANKKAYLNACGPATRNDKKGDGFCSHLDLEGFCGPSLHEYHDRKKDKEGSKIRRYEHSHSSPRSTDRSYTRYT